MSTFFSPSGYYICKRKTSFLFLFLICFIALESQTPSSSPRGKGPFRENNLIELIKLDSTIKLDIRYATTNNFTGRAVYSEARAFLQQPAAEALLIAHNWLKTKGYGILVYDAYRPWSVSKLFWDLTPADKKIFVADPDQGSVHNRGCAVDIGLFDLKTGKEIAMPGSYDEMSERSFVSYTGGTAEQRAHRDLLRKAMEQDGSFFVYPEEWWHFNFKDFAQYDIQNVPFSEISLKIQSIKETLAYVRQELQIPMRDGIKLNTVIYTPKNFSHSLPILFLRTPYGVSSRPSPEILDYTNDLAKDGYIFVFQDIRGRYKSEGTFEMQRLMRNKINAKSTDESTDTYDAIDWLVKNIRGNNGKVGMYGISYDGWTTMMGTIDPHPALKAASEQATPSDMYIGDDFHHNGAFRLSYGFEYAFMEEFSKKDTLFPFDNYDTYEWYLKLGPLSNVNEKYFHGNLPSWNDFVNHPDYDDFWFKQSMAYRLGAAVIPILHVAGWWDQEDFYGPQKAYEVLEKHDIANKNFIVIGPWNHGGWSRGAGSSLGKIKFGSSTGEKFRKEMQARFFAFYLKGVGDGKFPEAETFQTGSNKWKEYDLWPPLNLTSDRNLYFADNGKLLFNEPLANSSPDEYISDPAFPVPYRSRPVEETYGTGSRWYTWLVEDQRFVNNRPDVLSWETEILKEDIEITGKLTADIFASTSGTDADWIVKLIDVYPEVFPDQPNMAGYQLMIANDVLRGRYRNSFSKPQPVKPSEVNEYKIDLHAINHVFKTGHKIMVQVQSTWFPIIDRNPQKFVPNIFMAKETDFIKAIHRIYRSKQFPSHLTLPVVKH